MIKLIIDKNNGYKRIAIIENEKLVECYVEKEENERIIDNIYVGKVDNIIKDSESAFIDIGQKQKAFVNFRDIVDKDNLKVGGPVLVQVIKDASKMKGPKVSCNLNIAGKYVVITPFKNQISFSNKLTDREKRGAISDRIKDSISEKVGFIIRSAAEDAEIEDILKDAEEAVQFWNLLKEKSKYVKPPYILYEDSLIYKCIRDFSLGVNDEIIVNDEDELNNLKRYLNDYDSPKLTKYTNTRPTFCFYNIENNLKKYFNRKIWLKSGGYIIIDYTEAMTVIDVNSGKFSGKKGLESSILTINKEAAEEVLRQVRLRDIGGIILIDFIDMNEENSKEFIKHFTKISNMDKSKICVHGMTKLGIIEVSRRKVGNSLYDLFYRECNKCSGSGRFLNYEMIYLEILNSIADYQALMNRKIEKLTISQELNTYFGNKLKEVIGQNHIFTESSMKAEEYKIN